MCYGSTRVVVCVLKASTCARSMQYSSRAVGSQGRRAYHKSLLLFPPPLFGSWSQKGGGGGGGGCNSGAVWYVKCV